MYQLASFGLSIPFSIAEVERVNKGLKNIITEERSKLNEETIETLLFLYKKRFYDFSIEESLDEIN